MSTTVCQNVQSCFETLTLKLNPPNITQKSPSMDSTNTGWSCIESLSNTSYVHKESSGKLEVYVHPLVKRSKSMLSDKSLGMCTENLGSETGTDIIEDDDIFSMMSLSSLDSESERSLTSSWKPRYRKIKEESRKAGYESLPPPLTTMCGANTICVRPHRESGRLVMTAVTTSPRRASINAERCNGRLTMSLANDDVEEEEEEDEEDEEEEEGTDQVMCLIDGGEKFEEEEDESVEEEEGEQEEESLEEDMNGISKEVGEKFGIGEFQWLSRCKEGGRGTRRLINWETFCVAT